MLSRRQINVQRENLAAMCRISVKSLLDYACLYSHVDDDCEEFINFCAVFEQMVSHRLRPIQKKWLPGHGSPRHFWDVLLENHHRTRGYMRTCIPNIEEIESIKSAKAKLRAFIRVALMEKRLSDYLYWLLDSTDLIQESYLDGALISSDDAVVLCGDLIGLNAIDFNFCLKGNENELLGPLEISYGPFLKYKQTSASRCTDEIEMLRLSGKEADEDIHPGSVLTERNVNDILRLQNLEKDFKSIKEQKDYLEELIRLRDRQLIEANTKVDSMRKGREVIMKDMEKERKTLDACILELQAESAKLRLKNELLMTQVSTLKQYKDRLELKEVPMMDMAGSREVGKPEIHVEMDHMEMEDRLNVSQSRVMTTKKKELSPIPPDRRSIMSSVSDQLRLKEDSQSMVPLTGSLADVNAAMLDSRSSKEEQASCSGRNEQEHLQSETREEVEGAEEEFAHLNYNLLPSENPHEGTSMAVTSSERGESENENNNHASSEGASIPPAMTESYVLAGDDMEVGKEADDLNSSHIEEHEPWEITNENPSADNEAEGHKGHEGMVAIEAPETLDGGERNETTVLSDGTDSFFESEREDEVVFSDPEIVNPSNTSSDGSDAVWEMLSEHEHDES